MSFMTLNAHVDTVLLSNIKLTVSLTILAMNFFFQIAANFPVTLEESVALAPRRKKSRFVSTTMIK